jgi:hypothetical protein
MRDIVKFLLARMETHPEEFYQDKKSGVKFNWSHQIKDNKKFMTDDEYKAVWGKYSEINLERAMRDVTERLLAPEPVVEELVGFGNALAKAEGKSVAYAMKNRYQIEEIQAQMEYQRKMMEQNLKASVFDKEY